MKPTASMQLLIPLILAMHKLQRLNAPRLKPFN